MFRCDVHLGSNHKKAPNTWNFTISKKAQIGDTPVGSTHEEVLYVSCAWSEPLDLSTHRIDLEKPFLYVLFWQRAWLVFFSSRVTVHKPWLNIIFHTHSDTVASIPPATINDFFFPKEIIKIISVVLQYARTRCRCVENIKAKTSLNRFFLSCQLVHE